MPKTHVSRSQQIDAPIEKVFNTLSNFNEWLAWSPWLICEPDATVKVDDDNKYYEWEGRRIGSGNMRITHENPNSSVDYNLVFLKPWKSKAKVRFTLEPAGEGTKATWIMDSSLPFFMFWMKRSMEAFIGMDFDRGLNMLKEYIEEGTVKSKLEFVGTSEYPGCQYIGIKRECDMDDLGKCMSEDLDKLSSYTGQDEGNIEGAPFSIYHKWDLVKKKVAYTSGIPLKKVPDSAPQGMITGSMPAIETYTLRHIGPYLHLGNAWSTLMSMQRAKEFRPKKGFHPFETYVNHPGQVPEEELITDIHFGLKS